MMPGMLSLMAALLITVLSDGDEPPPSAGDWLDEARGVAAELSARFPRSAEVLVAIAGVEQRSGSLLAALDRFQEALRLDPKLTEARESLGDILSALGKLSEAAEEYRAALLAGGDRLDRARWARKRGHALLVSGRLAEAEAALREAAAADPQDAATRSDLARALIALGRPREALGALDEAQRFGERDPSIEYSRAQVHFSLGDAAAGQEALARYRAARERPIDGKEFRARRDRDREGLDRRSAALAHLDAARIYRRSGSRDDARRHLEAALRWDRGFSTARYLLAQLAAEMGDLDRATAEYETLITAAADPGALKKAAAALYERRVRALLGEPAAARGRVPEILGWARRAVELDPSGSAHEAAAWASLAAGDRSSALTHLREAVRLDPSNVETLRRLRTIEKAREER